MKRCFFFNYIFSFAALIAICGVPICMEAQTCANETLTASTGTFSLPTQNGKYAPGLRCSWTIKPPRVRQIMLKPDNFDIQEKDLLLIFGSQDSVRPLARLTGLDLPQATTFADSVITVQFLGEALPAEQRQGGWTISYSSSPRVASVRTEDDRLAFDDIPFGNSSKILNTRVTVSNLLTFLTVTPPKGFKVSVSQSGPFLDTLRIQGPSNGSASSQLYVQFVPSEAGEFSGRIVLSAGSTETFITVSGLAAPAIYWEPMNGPFSGRVVALGNAAGNTLIAGTGSGIYRSNSNGAVWLQSNTGLNTKSAQDVFQVVSWQRNTCILTKAGMFRSQDSGRTWRRMPTNIVGSREEVEPTTLLSFANTLFIGTTTGVYRLTQGGSAWEPMNKDLPQTNELNVTALTEQNGRLYLGLITTNDIGSVYTSIDSGKSWSSAVGEDSEKAFPQDDYHYISHFASVGNRLYAVVAEYDEELEEYVSVIYRTDNNAGTWEREEGEGLTDYASSYEFNDIVSVGTTLYLATEDGVFRRTNAGPPSGTTAADSAKANTPWQQVNRGITEVSAQVLAANGANIYVGTYGGVFRSGNQGSSWVPVNQGLTAAQVYTMEEHRGVILAGTEGSGIYRSIDNGITWIPASNGLPARYIGDIYSTGTELYACGYDSEDIGNGLYTSPDNGASWVRMTDFPISNQNSRPLSPRPDIFAVTKDSRGYLFAGGSTFSVTTGTRTRLYYSVTNGISWIDAPIPKPIQTETQAVWALEDVPGLGMIVGTNGDGAYSVVTNPETRTATWTTIPFSDENEDALIVRNFATYKNVLFAATEGGLYRLNRNRLVFEPVDFGKDSIKLKQRGILTLEVADGLLYIGTFGAGAWRTSGQQWEQVQDGLLEGTDVYSLIANDISLFAGLGGNAIFRTSLQQSAATARARLDIDDNFTAAPGDSVTVIIKLGAGRNLPSSPVTITGILRFNASLLDPGEALRNEAVVNGERLLPFRAQLRSNIGSNVATFKFRALLGNSVATPLTLTNLAANGVLLTSLRPGLFTLKNLSEAGGTRLFIADSKPILTISPNPASDMTSVRIKTFEFGETIVSVTNTFGQTMKTFVTPDMEPGEYDFSTLTREMPQGVYFVTVQTPTNRVTRQLQVVR